MIKDIDHKLAGTHENSNALPGIRYCRFFCPVISIQPSMLSLILIVNKSQAVPQLGSFFIADSKVVDELQQCRIAISDFEVEFGQITEKAREMHISSMQKIYLGCPY